MSDYNSEELRFLYQLALNCRRAGESRATPRDIIEAHGFVPKQAHRWLQKYYRRGWYCYGVTLDLGWIEPAFPSVPTPPPDGSMGSE